MALATSTIIAAASLAVGVAGGYMQYQQQQKANARANEAADANKQIRAEQQAAEAQKAAQEQRQQIRERRIRAAQILQASENTGVAGSSGEAGALSSIATQFSSNQGFNIGAISRGNRISNLSQTAADANTAAANAQNRGQMFGQISGLGQSIFAQAGGPNALFKSTNKSVFDVGGNIFTNVNWGPKFQI